MCSYGEDMDVEEHRLIRIEVQFFFKYKIIVNFPTRLNTSHLILSSLKPLVYMFKACRAIAIHIKIFCKNFKKIK